VSEFKRCRCRCWLAASCMMVVGNGRGGEEREREKGPERRGRGGVVGALGQPSFVFGRGGRFFFFLLFFIFFFVDFFRILFISRGFRFGYRFRFSGYLYTMAVPYGCADAVGFYSALPTASRSELVYILSSRPKKFTSEKIFRHRRNNSI